MVQSTLVETNRRRHQVPLVCATRVCLDGCEPAYVDVATECGLMSNPGVTGQNGASHITHSVILSYRNPNPNKTDMVLGALPFNKIVMAFCLRGRVAQMHNELRENPTKAYRT